MPVKDKTGQKFGHLTVIKLSNKRNTKNNKILWECQCDCGNPEIIYATTANLTQGYKTSCGCAKINQLKTIQKNNIKDISGQKFGKLTALYQIEGISPPLWHCICDCGNELDASSSSLTKKERTSCGCGRKQLRKNLIGQRFGKLVVIEQVANYISPRGQTQIQYKCKCDCGNELIVMATSLTQGYTSSCGCLRSAGEMVVEAYLKNNNIIYQREYTFVDCKDKRKLPFDFCIFNQQGEIAFLIEVNGKQHYEPRFGEDFSAFELQKLHDNIKVNYCNDNNYDLLVIPYYQLNNFQNLINERIKKHEL